MREKELIINASDSTSNNTEKKLKELSNKIPTDKKTEIENALKDLKEAHKKEDLDQIDAISERLTSAWAAASQDIYQAGEGAAQADAGAAGAQTGDNTGDQGADEDRKSGGKGKRR